jgi:hypothetical protein
MRHRMVYSLYAEDRYMPTYKERCKFYLRQVSFRALSASANIELEETRNVSLVPRAGRLPEATCSPFQEC